MYNQIVIKNNLRHVVTIIIKYQITLLATENAFH